MTLFNGQNTSVAQALAGTDEKGKTLKFKQDGQSTFTAKGSDGKVYSFDIGSTVVRVDVSERVDYKRLRKEGRPVPRDKAKDIDEQLKRERERNEKVTKGEMKPEDAAKEAERERLKEEEEYAKEVQEESGEEKKTDTTSAPGTATGTRTTGIRR